MSPTAAVVEQLAALIRDSTGNLVPPARFDFLGEIAERRARAVGLKGPADYVRALAAGELAQEWASLVPLITIKESYFFRAPQQFEALERQLLPRLLRARAGSRRLRIWSAACARGEEPATLAMVLAEYGDLAAWDWDIVATDLDEEALAGARRGLYGERAVAQVPPALLARYFGRQGKLFELSPELRARIDYRLLNLAEPPYPLPSEEFDLILLRNVLIYFPRPLQTWVMTHIAQLLSRRGALFLGASETLWQIQDELEAIDLGTCYCYRHRRVRPPTAETAQPPKASAQAAKPSLPAAKPPAATRGAKVGLPADKLRRRDSGSTPPALAASSPPPSAASGPRSESAPAVLPDVSVASAPSLAPGPSDRASFDLSRAAGGAPPTEAGAADPLLAAILDLAANRPAEARHALDQALAADPSVAAVHVLDGFLHDLAGRPEEAAASYRASLYLDPALFQPRLLLADCLLRLGQRDRAEHQFREVLATLDAGRERLLPLFEPLPLPDRDRALRRCRQALQAS